ncbi:MAG: hypothetical protein F6K58_16855 [Symploca sp. SIO2E9]|nr:hypothetical protein [Symploca sp. SIO2E9]
MEEIFKITMGNFTALLKTNNKSRVMLVNCQEAGSISGELESRENKGND